MSTLNATDLFAVRRGSQTYKVSYQDVLAGVVLPSVLTYMGATNPAAAAPAPAGGLKAGMTYVLTPAGTLSAGWTGIAGINATDGQLAIWEGAKWELIGNTGAIPHATEAVSGIVELATAAETTTGTDNTRAVHPAGLKVELDKKAPKTTTSDTAPANPQDGDLWYDSVGGELYVWYDSDDAGAAVGTWVQANPQPTPKQATASVAGVDVKLWKKTGTTLETETAGDVVSISAGTAALPGLTPVGDPNTGIYSPGADQLAISTNGTEKARITSDGQLLMGTATPLNPTALPGSINVSQGYHTLATGGYKFTVNAKDIGGLVYDYGGAGTLVAMNLGTDGTGGGNGVGLSKSATSWSAYSDERMKADLEPIADGLEKVATLRAVTGRYKTDEVGTSRSFLIAQDVQAVLPEAVSGTTDDDDQLSLRYTEVIPLLVAALKEAKDKIEQLQTRITTLEARP